MRKSTKKAQIILVTSPIWEIEIRGSPSSLSFPDRLEQRLKEEN